MKLQLHYLKFHFVLCRQGPRNRFSSRGGGIRGEGERVSVSKLGWSVGMFPPEHFKFKSSELSSYINASKTANSYLSLKLLHRHLKQQVTAWPPP